MVRISRCCSPVSPTALRAALIRLASVDSETIRAPDRSQQIVFANYPIAVSDKEEQEIKHLGLDRQQHGSPPQLAALRVEQVIFEQEPHYQLARYVRPYGAVVSLAHFTLAKNQDGLNIKSMPSQSE